MRPRNIGTGSSVLALVFLLSTVSAGEENGPYAREFHPLADNVVVAQRPDATRMPVEGNVLLVFTERDVVVFDGGGTPQAARSIVEYIHQRSELPVSVLVNSHGHLDHTGGNQTYAEEWPGLEILAGPGTYRFMTGAFGDRFAYAREIAENPRPRQERGEKEIAELVGEVVEKAAGPPQDHSPATAKADAQAVANFLARYYREDVVEQSEAFRELEVTPPTAEVAQRYVLYRETGPLEVRFLGYGKTPGDLVLWLPENRLVATGDLLTHPIPYGFSRAPSQWLGTLRALALLGEEESTPVERFVPGHGAVLEGTTYLEQVIALVEETIGQVAAVAAAGADRDEVLERVHLTPFREAFSQGDPVLAYLFDEWYRRPVVMRALDERDAKAREGVSQ